MECGDDQGTIMQNANAVTVLGEGRDDAPFAARAAHQQPGTKTGYIGMADAARIVRRRRWLILLVVAAAVLATMAFLARTHPVYSASTMIMVLPQDQANPAAVPAAAPIPTPTGNEDANIQTKVELFQSRSLARQTALSLGLANDSEFAPPPGGPGLTDRIFGYLTPGTPVSLDAAEQAQAAARARAEAVTDKLIDRLSVDRVARSNVIQITASSTDPAKAARIANRLVDSYIRGEIEDANESRGQEIAALSARVANMRTYLQRADSAAAAYRRQHGLLSSQPETSGGQQTAQLAGLLTQAQGESAADTRKSSPGQMPGGGVSAMSPLLAGLQEQEATLARKLGQLSTFYGPGYPEVAQTTAELNVLRTRIAQETARVAADLGTQASASQAKSAGIGAAIAGVRARSFAEGQWAVPLRALERNVDAVNTTYTMLLNQLNAKIGSPIDVNPDISRISRAPVPDTPSYPLPKRVLAVVAAAALALGLLLALAIETMDTKLRTAEQVRRLLGIPTLAMIPELEGGGGPVHSAVASRPRSRFAEAMRNLIIELETRIASDGSRVVVVTSPLEGEGKNTVATSLAAAAAVIGRHVVVVDFDLRRPGLTGDALVPAEGAGVVAYLAERAIVDDLVPVREEGRFAIIGVGETASDPGALIASPRLPQLLDQLRERFELVVLNAPPILPVRDAKTLADHADGTLMVLRWGRTSPEAAAAAMELFDRPIVGAVLNRVDYAVHAGRRYGDAIHHIARSQAYYEADAGAAGSRGARLVRRVRRAIGRGAEALHLA